jgi:hypothetical protein
LFGSSSAIIYKNFKKDQIMKRTLVLTFSFLTMATFMAGCGQMPSFSSSTTATAEECETLDKKLIKVDDFLVTVEKTSAFHLEELATAIPKTEITTSNNKKTMLKDGHRKKAELLAEQKRLGCETSKK